MQQMIREAIQTRSTIRFRYKGTTREVEPHTVGTQQSGNDALSAWQLGGGSGEGFRLYLLGEIQSPANGVAFAGPRPGYRRGDRRFTYIFAEL